MRIILYSFQAGKSRLKHIGTGHRGRGPSSAFVWKRWNGCTQDSAGTKAVFESEMQVNGLLPFAKVGRGQTYMQPSNGRLRRTAYAGKSHISAWSMQMTGEALSADESRMSPRVMFCPKKQTDRSSLLLCSKHRGFELQFSIRCDQDMPWERIGIEWSPSGKRTQEGDRRLGAATGDCNACVGITVRTV